MDENDESKQKDEVQSSKKIKLSENTCEPAALSKNQRKKLAKRQQWLELRPLRKAKEKEKHKRKLQEAKLSGELTGLPRKALKSKKMEDSTCKIRVVFDLSFDEAMTEFELSKTLKQLNRCYSYNRRASAPLQLFLTGYSDNLIGTINHRGILNWDMHVKKAPFEEIFDKESIVYLSSESSDTIETLESDKVYIIGALVDHNRLKGISHKKALDLGVAHAKLPLDDYIKMEGRKVLTIDQVYLILLKVSEGKSWDEAFIEVIPKRKSATVKNELKPTPKQSSFTVCADNNSDPTDSSESYKMKTTSSIASEEIKTEKVLEGC